MNVDPAFLPMVAAIALASFACRAGGFLLMRYVRSTPRVEAALRAVPLAVMIGIVAPSAAAGRLPELLGLAVIGIAMKVSGNDLVAAVAGVATVAVLRHVVG